MTGISGPQSPLIDLCKVPAPAGPVPTPYPNTGASGWGTTDSVRRVKLQTKHGVSATRATEVTSSTGDEAGTLKGIISPKTTGAAQHLPAASKVQFEGNPAVLDFSNPASKF